MEENSLLIVQDKSSNDQWEVILTGDELVIGREKSCDLTLPDRQVSRQHATILRRGDRYLVRDEGSRNGTFLNGTLLHFPQPLQDGDEIRIAARYVIIFVATEATAPLYRPGPSRHGIYIDRSSRRVWVNGVEVEPPLSAAQYRLIEYLYERDGAICTRDNIIEAVWTQDNISEGITDQAVDALVRRLRSRLVSSETDHDYIETVRGHGFRLNQP